ncbi:hypothetical protein [Cyclobacterium jeungdonense]|nr:hypothetical protein [Cyclobacterium jeungdonense]
MRGGKCYLESGVDGLQSATAACPNRMDPPTSLIALGRMQKNIFDGPK